MYKKMKDVTEKVEGILIKHPKSRDDDWLLYGYLLNCEGHSVHTSFHSVYEMVKMGEFPSMETVGRIRRKVQETKPELRGTERKQKARKVEQEKFREYYGK